MAEVAVNDHPDLVVGIDFGVAYALPKNGGNIRWIQKWPGRAQANENKVPTVLVYPHEHDRPSSWGFRSIQNKAEQNPLHGNVREWFKTSLDPANIATMRKRDPTDTTAHEDVRHWYRDFFTLLYEHVEQKLSQELPNFEWSAANIEFLFSMPTTWNHQIVEMFREIVGQAGFGGPANAQHTVTMSLTEAEAAAVHVSTEAAGVFQEGDILVVCDAGGGTTDLSALEVTHTMVDALSLKQLRQIDVVGGDNIGSVAIDIDFERKVRARLDRANASEKLGFDSAEAAWEMAKGKDFQNMKCEHGALYEPPSFSVTVETDNQRLRRDYANEEARIYEGEMHFDKDDLRDLFDRQCKKLFRLIDRQLRSLSDKLPDRQVSHLVLSGGLGQSPYVQQKLKERYHTASHLLANTDKLQVRVAPDPQLAVCKGLVADRLRKLKAGESVLGWRCCRASYGLICKEIYSKKNPKHVGRKTSIDSRDGQLYVPECIDWFVEKGSPVSIDTPIVHTFRRKIGRGDPRKVFPTKIVVSYLEKDQLPYQFEDGVEKLCEVESDLSVADETRFVEKNRRFWQAGEPYLEVEFQVKVVIGPADLRFELWFGDQKMSRENSIKVEWAPSTAPSTAALPPSLPAAELEDSVWVIKEEKSSFSLRRLFSGGNGSNNSTPPLPQGVNGSNPSFGFSKQSLPR